MCPADPPICTHTKFIEQANQVSAAETINEANGLAKGHGIKGLSVLTSLGCLNFPLSFTFDFMNLIFENWIPNLVQHYAGTFRVLDCDTQNYLVPQEERLKICAAGEASGDTIPTVFGVRVPNLETDRSSMTRGTVVLTRKVKLLGPISRPWGLLLTQGSPLNGVPTACPFWDPLARSGATAHRAHVLVPHSR